MARLENLETKEQFDARGVRASDPRRGMGSGAFVESAGGSSDRSIAGVSRNGVLGIGGGLSGRRAGAFAVGQEEPPAVIREGMLLLSLEPSETWVASEGTSMLLLETVETQLSEETESVVSV